eukprot:15467897-Alexandrium_andersonii.AAC.1
MPRSPCSMCSLPLCARVPSQIACQRGPPLQQDMCGIASCTQTDSHAPGGGKFNFGLSGSIGVHLTIASARCAHQTPPKHFSLVVACCRAFGEAAGGPAPLTGQQQAWRSHMTAAGVLAVRFFGWFIEGMPASDRFRPVWFSSGLGSVLLRLALSASWLDRCRR